MVLPRVKQSVLGLEPLQVECKRNPCRIRASNNPNGGLRWSEAGMQSPAPADSSGAYIDLGLLDLRHSKPVLPANYSTNADAKYSKYSLCWFHGSYLSPTDQAIAAKLPIANGDATSDYCSK